jgi:hypothetical protein
MDRTISRDDGDALEHLPHGAVVTIPGTDERLIMDRESGADPLFECFQGPGDMYTGYLRWHNVFSFYGVETVQVSA